MKGYRFAIDWLAFNDDNNYLKDNDDDVALSVSASLVSDLFEKNDAKVASDVRRRIEVLKKAGLITAK